MNPADESPRVTLEIAGIDSLAAALAPKIAEILRDDIGQPATDRPLYTSRTLAQRLGVHERTARQRMLDGEVESFKLGDGDKAPLRATPEAVDAYIARLQSSSRS